MCLDIVNGGPATEWRKTKREDVSGQLWKFD